MTQQYDNTNRGALFKNTRREKDSHPEYNGSVNVDGVDYWISAWVKDGRSGKFFSLSVKRKDGTEARPEKVLAEVQKTFPDAHLDDDIPF